MGKHCRFKGRKVEQYIDYLCQVTRNNKNVVLEKVLVENYAAEGKSLARVQGKVVFIDDTVPGDVVDVRLSKNKKDWAEGHPVQFHQLSADRVVPFCEHFGVCGGCQWQMLPYEKQLGYKQKQVEDTLQRIGKVTLPPIQAIIGSDQNTHYRNKIEYTFANRRYLLNHELNHTEISGVENVAGFHAQGIFDKVVDIRECHLQVEPTNALRLAIKQFAIDNNFEFYDIKNHTGFLRTVQVRICRTGELMVNIVFGSGLELKRTALLNYVRQSFAGITTLLYTINTKLNDSYFDLNPVVYFGKGFVIEKLEDLQFKIGPKSFFQTNTQQAERLYQVTRELSELKGNETVYDLYCGTGSIGIFLSRKAKKVLGIEIVKEAVDDARENAALNGILNADFFCGDVVDTCNESFSSQFGKPDAIITDPPRAGMHEKLVRKILDIAAPIVVYVSCNPATQARDLNLMDEKYTITKVQPVDMFPHTHHIETVVQLKLRS